MASLATTYKEYILEQLMLKYLYDGEIPTSDDIEDDLETYMEVHPDMDEPASKRFDWSVKPGENSRASKIQDIAHYVSQDVGVVTREFYRIAEVSSRFYDRWSSEMKRLSGFARKLEQRADSLLLLAGDTTGFFAYVGDVFADMSKVDTELTDARVDLHETAVTINPSHDELTGQGALLDLGDMTENDVSFTPLSQHPGIAYMTTGDGNMLSNIFETNSSTWVGRVVSDSAGDMVCELKARLSNNTDLEVSRIAVEFVGPLGTTSSTVTCLYSEDGYVWNLVPSVNATKTLERNMSWIFSLTTMRWVKFIFRKTAPDNVDNEYIFSISYVRIYGNDYDSDVGNTFYSTAMQALDAESNPILFSLVALNTCQETPANTGITYYLSASRDGDIWTDWMGISHSEADEVLYPKIINLSGANWKDNTEFDDITLLNDTVTASSVAQMQLTNEFSNTTLDLLGYKFKNTSFGVVNTAITVSEGEDPDLIGNSVVVWRNVRYRPDTDYPDTLTVRSNPRGWGINGSDYVCYFEVVDSDGIILDFGERTCTIDGAPYSGVVQVDSGIHKFTTQAENWFDIADNITDGGYASPSHVGSTEELEALDPLYPYNHKLIIEGFPYVTGFQGEKAYTGTDISAEFYATRTSLFDLENNHDTYGYFSVRRVGSESSPTLAVIMHYDASNPDYANELNVVKWRSGASDTTMYKYAKLKAVLWTNDAGVTPSLTSYRLKLGM
jgi:hypothetical protein